MRIYEVEYYVDIHISYVRYSRSHNNLVSGLKQKLNFLTFPPSCYVNNSRNSICEISIKTDVFKPFENLACYVIPHFRLIII